MFHELEQAWIGKRVRFDGACDAQVSFSGGDDPRTVLVVGAEYTVKSAYVGSWKTRITLEGFDKLEFNSVCFTEIGEIDDAVLTDEPCSDEFTTQVMANLGLVTETIRMDKNVMADLEAIAQARGMVNSYALIRTVLAQFVAENKVPPAVD